MDFERAKTGSVHFPDQIVWSQNKAGERPADFLAKMEPRLPFLIFRLAQSYSLVYVEEIYMEDTPPGCWAFEKMASRAIGFDCRKFWRKPDSNRYRKRFQFAINCDRSRGGIFLRLFVFTSCSFSWRASCWIIHLAGSGWFWRSLSWLCLLFSDPDFLAFPLCFPPKRSKNRIVLAQ